MRLLNQIVKDAFGRAIQAAFPSLTDINPVVASSKYGDFQCNSALALWKKEGKLLGLQSAKEAADRVAEKLRIDAASPFSSVQVSPQGFITADVAASWLQEDLVEFLEQQELLPPLKENEKRKVIVDFSSPNVAKEMHVGHLRSTIIGESISRILEFRGYDVERVNHIGDWGTQFGMLIEYLHSEFPNYKESMPDISDLNAFYKQAKATFDADEGFKKRSRDMVVKLQGGDPAALDSWRVICEISRKEFDKVYQRLGVQLEERGESTYNEFIPSVVRELTEKGMVSESDGAKCVFTSAGDVPLLLVKSDGGYGYDTTDIAAIRDRLIARKGDWLIYVTDLGQEDHFMKVFAAAKAAGWHQPPRTRLDHVGFGVVQGQDGKRFKTRIGEAVKLVDLLDEATARALKELLRRRAEEEAAANTNTTDTNATDSNTTNTKTINTNSATSSATGSAREDDEKENGTTDASIRGGGGGGRGGGRRGENAAVGKIPTIQNSCDGHPGATESIGAMKKKIDANVCNNESQANDKTIHPEKVTVVKTSIQQNGHQTPGGSDTASSNTTTTTSSTGNNNSSSNNNSNKSNDKDRAGCEKQTNAVPATTNDATTATTTSRVTASSEDIRKTGKQAIKREDDLLQQQTVHNGLSEKQAAGVEEDIDEEATEEMKHAAEAIGYSAVKYFDLKQNRHTDYKFSYDRMLDPKGNTAVYMLYAYARICAIFRKAGIDPTLLDPKELRLVEPGERKLALLLAQFPDIVYVILEDLHIHRLAEYMYKVAGAFTDFYQTCKVLGVPQQNSRLLLSECTRKILQTCFSLLGITPLQRL